MMGKQDGRQSWEEWIPVEDHPDAAGLLTRKEILACAHDLNVRRPGGRDVDVRAMRYWEDLGIIPQGRPSESGYHQNLWPWWVVDMLYQVCCYEAAGFDLKDLPDIMHVEAERLARDPLPRRKQRRIPMQGNPEFWATILAPDYRDRLRDPTHPPFRRPPDVTHDRNIEQLIALLNKLSPSSGFNTRPSRGDPTRVRLSYVDEHGESVRSYDVALKDPAAIDDFITQDKAAYEQDVRANQAEMMEQVHRWLGETPAKE